MNCPNRILIPILMLFFAVAGNANELGERNAIREEAARLFQAQDFASLERMATEFRNYRSKTESGTWKLPFFYNGVTTYALEFDKSQDVEWEYAASDYDSWLEAYPNSPTAYVAKGAVLLARGWTYRGQTWARDVDPEDMAAFRQFAIQAGTFLMENAEVASSDPHWYATLADVYQAVGVNKEDYLAMIDEGLTRYPNYDQLYFESTGYLSAKWHGSDEELEAFAQSAVEKTKEERGYEVYARIYWAAGMRNKSEYSFQSPNANWYDMIKGMDDVIQRYPSQWNINHFAYFSCFYWDEDATRKYMALIEEPIVEQAWSNAKNYAVCRHRLNRLEKMRREIEAGNMD